MNQFFKIALDHPAKAEKIFLWVLQSILIYWFLSVVFNIQYIDCFNDSGNFQNDCINSVTSLDIAFFLIIYAVTWFIVWELIADLAVKLVFLLFNRIISFLSRLLGQLLLIVLYVLWRFLAIFKIVQKPKKYWQKPNTEKSDVEHINKMNSLREDLGAFDYINTVTNSSVGYRSLLSILSHEKAQFIQSRVIRYYTILLIVVIAKSFTLDLSNLTPLFIIGLVISVLLGFMVFGLNDIYTRLNSDDVHFLIPQLEFEVFKDFIFESLSKSILIDDYVIMKKRKSILAKLKDRPSESILTENYFKEIHFIPLDDFVININQILLQSKRSPDMLMVIVTNFALLIPDLNRIVESKFCHIQTTDRNQFMEAILRLRPIFIGSQKL